MRCAIAGVLLSVLISAGCAAPAKRSETSAAAATNPVAPITNDDACATQLHEFSGALLSYYTKFRQLPSTLGNSHPTCPVSGEKYIYNPVGLPGPKAGSRVILYDPAPSHAGGRWALAIIEPTGDQALVTDLLLLPDAYFRRAERQ